MIELLVKPGDTVKAEQSLITVESDKASMEIPSPHAGVVKELKVKLGDKVAEGSVIAARWRRRAAPTRAAATRAEAPRRRRAPAPLPPAAGAGSGCSAGPGAPRATYAGGADLECDMLVLGAGPGGYSAAFRAADLGMKVVLVERYATLGGVCLNVGCIPSKALLHVAAVMDEVSHFDALGVELRQAEDRPATSCVAHKDKVVGKLTGGLAAMAKMRKVTVRARHRQLRRSAPPRGAGTTAGRQDRQEADRRVQATRSSPPARRRCSCRSCRTTRASSTPPARSNCGSSEAHADHRRRHHRPGNGHRVLDAGRAAGRGRDARRPDAGRRPRPGAGLAEDERAALRQHHAEDQDRRRRGDRGRHPASASKARGAQGAAALRPGAAGRRPQPNGKKIGADKAGVAVSDAASSRSTSRCAPTCRTSSPSATSSASRCWRTRRCTRRTSRRRSRRRAWRRELARRLRCPRDPERRLHRPRDRLGGPDRGRGQGAGHRGQEGPCSRGRASGRAIANGRDEGFTKLLFDAADATASSAAASSARMPAT